LCASLFASCAAFAQSPDSCGKLAKLPLEHAIVNQADSIAAGAFTAPPVQGPPSARRDALFKALPAFCRVRITAKPSSDSDIKIEVWLPESGWNGRLQAYGNGGFAGSIEFGGLAEALSRGYAVASTDTGHSGTAVEADWAAGHPEKMIDFAHRG